ncbi:MAG: glycosyltransferase [Bacteroidetes bacterium]|nr:glycosyltransferase [Bacteroidota bacterium]
MSISVVTCIRNQEPSFFMECAASIVAQDEVAEWIVVDDGSTPEAALFHKKVIESVPSRIRTNFLRLKRSYGLSIARNIGLEATTGDWVVILDSDDRLGKHLFSELTILPPTANVVCLEAIHFGQNFTEHRRIQRFAKLFRKYAGSSLDPFLWYDFYYHGLIARRELFFSIGGYSNELSVGEDQDILLRAVESTYPEQVIFIPKVGYEYRWNPNGVCETLWSDVLKNYTKTMLDAATRRSAEFIECRYGGTKEIDGAVVDYYQYQTKNGNWCNWVDLL